MRTFFQIHTSNSAGDVLIFLPGQEEIENLRSSIKFYARQLPQGAMPVKNVGNSCFPPSHNPSRSLCTPCIPLSIRHNSQKSFSARHTVPGNASSRRTLQKPRLRSLALNTLSILESAKKGDTSPGNPGAVDLSHGDGGLAQLTPASLRHRYVIGPRHQQILRNATGGACGSRGLCFSSQ